MSRTITFVEMRSRRRGMPPPLWHAGAADDSGLCVAALGGAPAFSRPATQEPKSDTRNNENCSRRSPTMTRVPRILFP